MATRSRRNAAGSDSLNPAMIQLYDTGRLRRELRQRGLDTTGTRNVLADRLQVPDFVFPLKLSFPVIG